MTKPKVYLAGQGNEYENNWKEEFKKLQEFTFHDWEFDSDQTSPDTYFPDDLRGIKTSNFLVANPGLAPSEATWTEIGYFHAHNTQNPGDFCPSLIIVWREDRNPKWSIDFIKKMGHVVATTQEALDKLIQLRVTE